MGSPMAPTPMKPTHSPLTAAPPSFGEAGRPGAGETAEDRARDQAGAAWIIVVEEPADQFAGREEAGDRRAPETACTLSAPGRSRGRRR